MIWEALQHLFVAAPKHIKKMGYLKESIAIEARFDRCAKFWAPHLEECKKQILTATEELGPGSSVLILGSGGLHDVPMEELLERGFHMTCVDIVHLPNVKKKYPEVAFVEKDITGQIEPLYKAAKNNGTFFPESAWQLDEKPDLIISLNILSQLALNLVSYAKAKNYELGPFFENSTFSDHISWLKGQETKVLLISDVARDYYEGGELIETVAALPKLELDEPLKTWVWDVAPVGEAGSDISIRHVVGVWEF